MSLIQASFFWRNNEPNGIGFSFTAPQFTPEMLEHMFEGPQLKKYLRDSDDALGTKIVSEQLNQLRAIGLATAAGQEIPMATAILAALNIIWLTKRGFIPNDEFNGYQFITRV